MGNLDNEPRMGIGRSSPLRAAYRLAERVLGLDLASPGVADELVIAKRQAMDLLEVRKRGPGNPDLDLARLRGAAARKVRAAEHRAQMQPVIARLRAQGLTSYRQIAAALDAMGLKPPTADKWSPGSVRLIELGPKD